MALHHGKTPIIFLLTPVFELHTSGWAAFEEAGVFFMVDRFEVYADEAWTHQSPPLRRYWCFYGGVFGSEKDLGRLDTSLRAFLSANGINGEIKWSRVEPHNVKSYRGFVDCLLDEVERGHLRWRQMFCDRSFVRVAPKGESPASDLDVQFKLCYQFLKHSFGLEYLPKDRDAEVLIRLDTHSSQKHKDELTSYAADLPRVLGHDRLTVRVTFHQSESAPRIQVCDLIIGAAGSFGNKMQDIRENGRRGMTKRQKARLELCKHIYQRLRTIDAQTRGSKGFNWFESTGRDGDRTNMLTHNLRVWKFMPSRYQIDRGWQRDNLGPGGAYRGLDLAPTIQSTDSAASY